MTDKLMMAGMIMGVIALFAVPSYMINSKIETATIQVVSKERLMKVGTNGDGGSKTSYQNFVYSADESYVVEDSIWNWHFRAGTVYAKIPDGEATCDVTLSGMRMGFFSMYQNIIEADCK